MTLPAKRNPCNPPAGSSHPVKPDPMDATASTSVHEYRHPSPRLAGKAFRENIPILVKSIRLKLEGTGMESVYIEIDRYEKPAFTTSLDGENPRVSVVFRNAKLGPEIQKSIHAGGKFLHRIRTGPNGQKGELNITLDICPESNCRANYTHYLGVNLLRIDLSDGNHNQA